MSQQNITYSHSLLVMQEVTLADGNGNILTLVNSAEGTVVAEYEYSPFGETLKANGSLANSNPIRFSTKYFDYDAFLYLYGHRYYHSQTGRWLSRDPQGGLNLYLAFDNVPISTMDLLGLLSVDYTSPRIPKPVNLPPETISWRSGGRKGAAGYTDIPENKQANCSNSSRRQLLAICARLKSGN